MKLNSETVFYITLDATEFKNMIRVHLEYLNQFEDDSHDIDRYTLKILRELIRLFDDEELTKTSNNSIDIIINRCEGR